MDLRKDFKDACAVGSVAGLACCVGSCVAGVNPTIPSAATALVAGVTTLNLTKPSLSEKMKRIGGSKGRKGRKTKKKRRSSRYKKRRLKTRVM